MLRQNRLPVDGGVRPTSPVVMPLNTQTHIVVDRPAAFIVAVVDDDSRMLESFENLLESAGHRVRLFHSGAALLESGSLADIHCLISDFDMPGMDGFELLRRVHAVRPELPTILITAYPDALKRMPLDASGPRFFFTKPVQGHQLLGAVADTLRNAEG